MPPPSRPKRRGAGTGGAPAHTHPQGPARSTLHRQARRAGRVHTALSLRE